MVAKISRPGGETPTRSRSSAGTDARPASIFRAQVINVNSADYTVDVQYESYPYSNHFDIPWMTPYVHQNQGEGVAIMPEVGSTVWVCRPSESGKDAFVLGWTPIQEGGTYRAGRVLLNPGDQYFSTRDGNFIALRRGGIVQIGASPVCQRLFLPIRNIIRDFAENYELTTPGGDLTWEVIRTEESGDGHSACLLTLEAKEFSDDPNANPLITLKMGSHGDGNDTILSLQTRDKGNGSVKVSLTIDKSGKINWAVADDVIANLKGNLTLNIDKKMNAISQQDMNLESKAKLNAKGSEVHVSGGGATMDLARTASMNGLAVNLGDAIAPVVIDNGSLAAWIAAVTVLLSGPPSAIAFKGVLPPPFFHSTKVKA
jgi:hypothetical protein